SATGAAIPVTDLPFAITVVTKELLEDMSVYQLADLNKIVSSMTTYNRPYSDGGSQTIRGFSGNTSMDGLQTQTDSITREMGIVSRIEVLKGPSAILFPRGGSAGGTINVITKSPLPVEQGSLAVQAGRYNSNKVVLDYNGTSLADGKLLYRLVTVVQDTDGWSETDFLRRFIFFPA